MGSGNVTFGNLLWPSLNPGPPDYPTLVRDEACDVVVIGGGITGALVAHYLVEAGIDTVLIERSHIAGGSTAASTSILQYEVDYDITGLTPMIGADNAVRIFWLCAQALAEVEGMATSFDNNNSCGYAKRDCLYYTVDTKNKVAIEEEFLARKHNGFDVELLDAVTARDRFSFAIQAGILSRGLAGEIDPVCFTHALISKSAAAGMRVYENTDCTGIEPMAGGFKVIAGKEAVVRAKRVAVAIGYDTRRFSDRRLASLKTSFAIATAPVESFHGWESRCIIRDDANPYKYLRTTHDNRIIIGGRDTAVFDGEGRLGGFIPIPALSDAQFKALEGELAAMFPGIRGLRAEFRFAGIFGDTKDGLPYIGEFPGQEGIYYCMCFGSNGILYSALAGRIVTDLYLSGSSPDMALFSFTGR